MVIGIDIDGTLQDFEGFMKTEGKMFFHKEPDLTRYEDFEKFNVSMEDMKQFWNAGNIEMNYLLKQPCFANVPEVISHLHKENRIIVITNRGWFEDGTINMNERIATMKWLVKNGIPYDALWFNPRSTGKGPVCNELGIDVMIEDAAYQALDVMKKSQNTRVLLKRALHNQGIENAMYFNTWTEVYDIIKGGKMYGSF